MLKTTISGKAKHFSHNKDTKETKIRFVNSSSHLIKIGWVALPLTHPAGLLHWGDEVKQS